LDLLKASAEAMKMKSNHDNFETVTIAPAEPGWKTRPSELELRIRREVLDALDELLKEEEEGEVYFTGLLTKIKGHLNLLWSEQ